MIISRPQKQRKLPIEPPGRRRRYSGDAGDGRISIGAERFER